MIYMITCFGEKTSKNSKNNFYLGDYNYHYKNMRKIITENILIDYYTDKNKFQKQI